MAKLKFNNLGEIKEFIEQETERILQELTPEKITEMIHKQLSNKVPEFIATAIGFKKSFNEWEVDNSSTARAFIVQCMTEETKKIAGSLINDALKTFKLDASLKKAILNKYQRDLTYQMEKEIGARAEQDVRDFINSLTLDMVVDEEVRRKQMLKEIELVKKKYGVNLKIEEEEE